MTPEEAIKATKVKLSMAKPPAGHFEHTGKVLVEQKGKDLCVSEKALKGHIEDGAKIVNPTECSSAEQGRR